MKKIGMIVLFSLFLLAMPVPAWGASTELAPYLEDLDMEQIDAAAENYASLSFSDKKRFLMEILDKNLLYVNYCDIDDKEFGISDEDKAFTKSFYKEE